jgi:hypothetical protein
MARLLLARHNQLYITGILTLTMVQQCLRGPDRIISRPHLLEADDEIGSHHHPVPTLMESPE